MRYQISGNLSLKLLALTFFAIVLLPTQGMHNQSPHQPELEVNPSLLHGQKHSILEDRIGSRAQALRKKK